MLIAAGMTSAITNPLKPELKKACMAADMLMGHDPDCMRWLRYQRQLARAAAATTAATGGPRQWMNALPVAPAADGTVGARQSVATAVARITVMDVFCQQLTRNPRTYRHVMHIH